jgi:hypothetical protein
MAGDVGFAERLVISGEMEAEAAEAPAPVLHEYGPNLRIGIGVGAAPPTDGLETAAAPSAVGALSEAERLGLDAFSLRQSPGYTSAKAARPYAGRSWGEATPDGPEVPDDHAGADAADEEHAAEAAALGTSDRLTGRVAVGLFMISGQAPGLQLTQQEQVKIVAEVQNGLSWLGAQSPAKDVTWVYEIHAVTVDVPDTTQGSTFEDFEAPWRDAALASLGLGTGLTGVQAYAAALRTKLAANWAYCAFFTRYTLRHFAYARSPRLVMHYLNDGWGPDNIDRVFAHETGHIFGAPDEYATSGCNCGGSHGFFKKPNGNCENCAPGGGVDCIMRANSWAMCGLTPFHLGFTMPEEAPTS